MIFPLIVIGKFVSWLSRFFNLGSGGTWPGEVALFFNPHIFSYFINCIKRGVVVIAGTNGKTTTAKMVQQILRESNCNEEKVVYNDSGANLLNGLVSAFIKKASLVGNSVFDWAILEVDEATVPIVISSFASFDQKIVLVFLNLFRDQLDRYGEVDLIAAKWKKALSLLPRKATVVLNADDPQVAYLGKNLNSRVVYFGINKPEKFLPLMEHATDSVYCRQCGARLLYKGVYFSHLGIWHCQECPNKRPKVDFSDEMSPIPGLYNEYNTLATVAVGEELGFEKSFVKKSLANFLPAFGRQEEFEIEAKKIKIFLSKNPAGFNASLRTVLEFNPKVILLVLNDQIPDGKDVSWIWDVDFEMIPPNVRVIVSGERVYDLALRIKYTLGRGQKLIRQLVDKNQKHHHKCGIPLWQDKLKIKNNLQLTAYNSQLTLIVESDLKKAINIGLETISKKEVLYILPTYSAMLQAREILTGRKIL